MVDPDRVRRLLERLSSYMASLQRLAAFPREEVLGDTDRIARAVAGFSSS